MFTYTSEQTHSDFVNGKLQVKTKRVTIRGTSGYKSVVTQVNGRKKTSKRKLTKKKLHAFVVANLFQAYLRTASRVSNKN